LQFYLGPLSFCVCKNELTSAAQSSGRSKSTSVF
jgi:hypothetical protein